LKVKDDFKEEKVLEEVLNTKGMDEAELALLQRQREVAIQRVRCTGMALDDFYCSEFLNLQIMPYLPDPTNYVVCLWNVK